MATRKTASTTKGSTAKAPAAPKQGARPAAKAATRPAAKVAPATKAAKARAPVAPPTPKGTEALLPAFDRLVMVAEAAYYRAERRGFAPGAEMDDWLAAEAEVERLLAGR